ncbi:MAG TPA: glycosyltransferase family 39 protein [Thermoleophilaceae bacterium]|nr:glycosyltransferase family 39 protein [Thermoleophilaceae bacterium]
MTAQSRWPLLVVLAATVVAAVNFLWQLGASSLFVDEVYSWAAAAVPRGDLLDHVRNVEITPPVYYAALHEWIGPLGFDSEAELRFPSAVCAIVLVPVLYDLGRRVSGEAAGAVAAVLVAVSPLVLDYAQEVRAYAPAMLLCALAAVCAARAVEGGAHRGRWAVAAGAAVALGLSVHYTTILVTAPVLALVLLTRSISTRARIAAGGVAGLTALVLAPLVIDQLGSGNQGGIEEFSRLTERNLLSILGTPWDSRMADPMAYHVIAAAITAAAIAWLLVRGSRIGRAVALGAALPLVAVFVATLVADDAIISRYTAASAPFALVAVAAAATSFTGMRRTVAVAAVLALALWGTWRGHDPDARFLDARAATEAIASDWREGDVVVTPAHDVTVDLPVRHYAGTVLPPDAFVVPGDDLDGLRTAVDHGARLWIVGRSSRDSTSGLADVGYDTETVETYRGLIPITLSLGTPAPGDARR